MYPCKIPTIAKSRQIAILIVLIIFTPFLFAFPVLVSSSSLGQKLVSPTAARAVLDSSFYLALTVLLVAIIFILASFVLYRLIIAYVSHCLRLDVTIAHTDEFPDYAYFIHADGTRFPDLSDSPIPSQDGAYRLHLGLTYEEIGHCIFQMRYVSHRLSYTLPLQAPLPDALQGFQPKVSLRLVGDIIMGMEEGDTVYFVYHRKLPAPNDIYSSGDTEFTMSANILNL